MPKTSEGVCEECDSWFESIFGLNLLRFSVLVLALIVTIAVIRIWEYNDSFIIRILKRGGVWATLEVFIGFCQIATLFVSVSRQFLYQNEDSESKIKILQ